MKLIAILESESKNNLKYELYYNLEFLLYSKIG